MLVSYKTIGRNIRQARNAMHLTQEQTAERLKMSQLHFGRLERGERPASLEQLANIALTLDVTLDMLLDGCVIEKNRLCVTDTDAQSFTDAIAHLVACCSPESRRLMLRLCQVVAEQDHSAESSPE